MPQCYEEVDSDRRLFPSHVPELAPQAAKPGSTTVMFGYPEPVKWKFDSAIGLKIDMPESLQAEDRRSNQYAWGWAIRTA